MPECPACKVDSDAIYVGYTNVECINPHCRHYSDKARKLYDEMTGHPLDKPKEEDLYPDDEDTDPMWTGLASLFTDPKD